jgi:hypothetical protein
MNIRCWFASLLVVVGCGTSDPDPSVPDPVVPFAQLERTRAIAPGATCTFGGTAVESGADRNRDHVLEDAEVDHVTTACQAAAPPTLLRSDAEPPGEHCSSGGQRIQTGPDRDGDGALGDDEVAATTYVCTPGEIFHGDFTAAMWDDPAAVAALHDARVITGSLTVASAAPVALPRLELVGGSLTIIQSGTPTAFAVPALAQVGADVIFRDAGFTGDVVLPALARVGGSFEILEPAGSTADGHTVAAAALVEVGASVVLEAQIAAVDLHLLRTVGGTLSVEGLPITELALPALTDVGANLVVNRNYQLAALDLHALRTVGGELGLGDLRVTAIELPVLVETGGLAIESCTASWVSLPALAAIHGSLGILGVFRLEELALPALRIVDGSVTIVQSLQLVHAALPVLESVGEHPAPLTAPWSLMLSGNALADVALPRLRRAPAGVIVQAVRSLTAFTLPALTETRQLTVNGGPVLTRVALPALTSAGAVAIDAPALTDLSLPQLAAVSDRLSLRRTQLVELHGLASATTIANLVVDQNPVLGSLVGLERLTAIAGQLTLTGNPSLASLAALANLTTVGGAVTFSGDPALPPEEIGALIQRVHP